MAKYVDTEKIRENAVFPYLNGDEEKQRIYRQGFYHALQVMERVEAENVAPVVHGKWVWDNNAHDWNLGAFVCSVCKCKNDNLPDNRYNPYMFAGSHYCPNCGAKMDGEYNDL